jgi:hypothetical protein
LEKLKNGLRLGRNESVKLTLTLLHIMANVVIDQTFDGGAWFNARNGQT